MAKIRGIPNSAKERKTFKYFTRMYAIALLVIACISILSQILIQRYLNQQMDDFHVINHAAKLRTYSQQLVKNMLLIESGRDIETNRKEFVILLKQWQKTHRGLIDGNEFLNIPVNDRDDSKMMFDIINQPYQNMVESSYFLIDELYHSHLDSLNLQPHLGRLLNNEEKYLLAMELIVFDFDRFSQNRVKQLKQIEYYLLAILLVVMFLEVLLIFAPLARRIQRVIAELIGSESRARDLTEEVKKAHRSLELQSKELVDVNFALEKAGLLIKTDAKGKILYANDNYCHLTKYRSGELRNKMLFQNKENEDESLIYNHIKDEINCRQVWQGEIFDRASDGTGFWIDLTLMPIINTYGKLYQYLAIGTDISLRKNAERELHQLMEEKIRSTEAEQKLSSYSFLQGQEKERKRVAAEIHDGIGQMLTSLRMKLEMLEPGETQNCGMMKEANMILMDIIAETRRICSDLLPSVLEDFGLESAINELVNSLFKNSEVNIKLHNFIGGQKLDTEIETAAYRILQESLNNILKHASATEIAISVIADAEFLSISVADNGSGFNYNEKKLFSIETASKSNGLRNMRERADLLGAQLSIESNAGKGTKIQVDIPL